MSKKNKTKGILTDASLVSFLESIHGLAENEVRKAKELYIRNAVTEYISAKKQYKNSWLIMALHLLIPIFWPMLFGAQKAARIELEETKGRIINAMDVWKNELGSEYHKLYDKLIEIDK